jgi:hypothetical protein
MPPWLSTRQDAGACRIGAVRVNAAERRALCAIRSCRASPRPNRAGTHPRPNSNADTSPAHVRRIARPAFNHCHRPRQRRCQPPSCQSSGLRPR